MNAELIRIKIELCEKNRTREGISEQLVANSATVSKWRSNPPSLIYKPCAELQKH